MQYPLLQNLHTVFESLGPSEAEISRNGIESVLELVFDWAIDGSVVANLTVFLLDVDPNSSVTGSKEIVAAVAASRALMIGAARVPPSMSRPSFQDDYHWRTFVDLMFDLIRFDRPVGCVQHCNKESHTKPDTCIECPFKYPKADEFVLRADEYIKHYLREHSSILPSRYICDRCQEISLSGQDCHRCQQEPQTNQGLDDFSLASSETWSQEYKISLALKSLPRLPTRETIAEWILGEYPPAARSQSGFKPLIYRILRNKFQETTENGWEDPAPNNHQCRERIPTERLIPIAFSLAEFKPLSSEKIYTLTKPICGDLSVSEASHLSAIKAHLERSKNYKKSGTTSEGKHLWSIIEEHLGHVTLAAQLALKRADDKDPGISFPDLVRQARAHEKETPQDIYEYVSIKYPFHARSRKRIMDAARRVQVGISKKRPPQSALEKQSKRIRTAPPARTTSLIHSPARSSVRSHTFNPLDHGIAEPIEPGSRADQVKVMHQKLLLISTASYVYRSEGIGLEEVRDGTVPGSFVRELVYNLHLLERQARDRAHMGDGCKLTAHLAGTILSRLYNLLFGETLIQPFPLSESVLPVGAIHQEDPDVLFSAGAGCFSCLMDHDQSVACQKPATRAPPYPSPRFQYNYHDLLLLLFEQVSSIGLADTVIYRWLRHHRSGASKGEIHDCISKYCETVETDGEGYNLLNLKPRFRLVPSIDRTNDGDGDGFEKGSPNEEGSGYIDADNGAENGAATTLQTMASLGLSICSGGPVASPNFLEHQQVHGSAAVRGTGLRQSDSSSSMPGVLIDRPSHSPPRLVSNERVPILNTYHDPSQATVTIPANKKPKVPLWIISQVPRRTEERWDEGKVQGSSLLFFMEGIAKVLQRTDIEKIKLTLRTPYSDTILTVNDEDEEAWNDARETFGQKLRNATMKKGNSEGYKILIEPFFKEAVSIGGGPAEVEEDVFAF
ncbi:hypothetical protein IFR05_015547 [Cadophora sp. M221]|nr:hypothetical protein IFR05_015547 [Cadophora sp. M221]